MDVVYVACILGVLGIAFLASHYVINKAADQMLATPAINESASAVTSITATKTMTGRMDYVVFGFFIASCLGIIITGWFIGGSPIFTFIYFLVLIVAVILSTIVSNVYEDISMTSVLSLSTSAFPITNHLLAYLPIYVAIIGFIGIVIMYAKPQTQ